MYSNNIEDILARAQYILACCQTDGNFVLDGHPKTEDEKRNEESCRSLCTSIEKILGAGLSGQRRRTVGLSDQRRIAASVQENIGDLLDTYDMLYRIGYGRQPDRNFMENQRNRVYEAWLKGNSRISESDIFTLLTKDLQDVINGVRENNIISPSPHLSNKSYSVSNISNRLSSHITNSGESVRLSDLYTTILENWLMTLKLHDCFPEVTGYENYRRLTLLMRLNLDRYFDDADEAKWRCNANNRLEDSDLKALPTAILKSYRAFNSSLFPTVLDYEDQQETDTLILEELSTRPDLNPYERKSYHLLVANRKALMIF